jgi:glycosyltransferase involved in cell wall biosynthesis
MSITAIILTHNEEKNISRCLESIKEVADEIIVVDTDSNDKTLEIAERYGAKIVRREFKNQAETFNWALDNIEIKGDWILRLDADEYLTPKLAEEIKSLSAHEGVTGFYMKRRVFFLGRWIRHGGYYPKWFLRLWREGAARYEEREVDEHAMLKEGTAGRLQHDFVDDNKKDLTFWTAKHNNYATKEASAKPKTNRYTKLPPFFRAFAYFIYRYIFRLGFLDGKEGLIFHVLQGGWYRFLVDAKIFEKNIKDI